MPTVSELAEYTVHYELLTSDAPHTQVAERLGVSEKSIRRWRKRHREDVMPAKPNWDFVSDPDADEYPEELVTFSTEDRQALHDKLDELLDETNANPESVKGMRVATWDAMHKDENNDAQVTRMYGIRLESSRWAPAWPVVQQAEPVHIDVDIPVRNPKPHAGKTAVILPDPQIGYRFYQDTQEYDPFHDQRAMDVALAVVERIRPDKVIFLGDYLDLPTFGKYEQEATFARTTQKSIDVGYQYLATIRAMLPLAEIVLLEGNHDRRLEKLVTRNAMEAFGLRRADDIGGWPVLSLPHLLRLSELGVSYVGGYPAGAYWINDRLKCIHGSIVRSSGSTAKAVVDEERVSVIFGHIHRIETQYKTSGTREGGRTRLAHTPGCLCRIDGAVPSYKGSTDLSGRPVEHYENWQQGLSVVSYEDGDGPFSIESVFINTMDEYRTTYGNTLFSA